MLLDKICLLQLDIVAWNVVTVVGICNGIKGFLVCTAASPLTRSGELWKQDADTLLLSIVHHKIAMCTMQKNVD